MSVSTSNQSDPATSGLDHYSADQPLLLLTAFAPTHGGGGAVNIRTVLDPADWERIVWVTMAPRSDYQGPERIVHLSNGPTPEAPRRRHSQILDSTLRCGALASEVRAIARRTGARAIWSILHGATTPLMARIVGSEFPVHLMVNDDPVGYTLMSRRYLAFWPLYRRATRRAITGAASVDVVSDGMEARYRRLYGRETVRVNRGVPTPSVLPEATFDRSAGILRIGVIGSTYGVEALRQLGEAVARAAATLGVRGELLVVGGGPNGAKVAEATAGRLRVETTGHLSEEEAIPRLRDCFLLYANYPFSSTHTIFRRTSFPIKLASYSQVGRPLLLHSPADSSIADLGLGRGFVTLWDSPDPDRGAALIADRWRDPAFGGSYGEEAEMLRQRFFDRETHRRTLMGALNALVPPRDNAGGHAHG